VHALNNGIEGVEQLRQSYASSGGLFTVLEDIELDRFVYIKTTINNFIIDINKIKNIN
jgi:hypothetical protein